MPINKKYVRIAHATASTVLRTSGKAVASVFRWATTDHSNLAERLASMPQTGFLAQMRFLFRQFLWGVLIAIASGLWVYFLIAYVLRYLLTL